MDATFTNQQRNQVSKCHQWFIIGILEQWQRMFGETVLVDIYVKL